MEAARQVWDDTHPDARWHRDRPAPEWRDVLWRVKERVSRDQISIIAAGVAFYALMAIFPALIALVGVYGMLFDPAHADQQIGALSGMLPPQAADLLVNQLGEITQMDKASLGVGAIVALLFALWSAAGGTRTLMQALNVAYHEEEKRGVIRLYGTALLLTLGAVLAAVVAMTLVVALPAIIKALGLGQVLENIIGYSRWVLLAAATMLGLAVLYRYGPSRAKPQWRWVSAGAVVATLLWLVASALFSVYVGHFANYNKTYGSLGAVVILLMWFLLTAWVILLGGEVNAETERQRP